MKHISYLFMSSTLLVSLACKNETKLDSENDSATPTKTSTETRDTIDHVNYSKVVSDSNLIDSVAGWNIKTGKDENLKVLIDGKTYYKKNASDFRITDNNAYGNNKYIYRHNTYDYDIRTGEFIPRRDGTTIVKTPTQEK